MMYRCDVSAYLIRYYRDPFHFEPDLMEARCDEVRVRVKRLEEKEGEGQDLMSAYTGRY